jgi:hypothetical protein
MNTRSVMRACLVAMALVAGLAGCGDDDDQPQLRITAEPADATVVVGATATFNVQSNTNPATYQWRRNGTDIPGASGPSYTTPATVSGDNGAKYSVVLTRGTTTVTSRDANLTVNTPPSITTQPAGSTVQVGATVSFSVVATGTAPLTYQWRKNGTNIAASYTTPTLTLADSGAAYSVVVTNVAASVTSANAIVTVQDLTTVDWGVNSPASGSGDFENASAGVDDLGVAYGVWLGSSGRVYASNAAVGGAWSTPALIDVGPDMTGNQGGAAPTIAVNPAGDGVVAWNFFTGGFGSHVAVVTGTGGVWSAPKKLASNVDGDPVVAIDDSGRAIAVWSSTVTNQKIMASVFDGTTWSAPVALARNPNEGFQPVVAVDGSGKGRIAYVEPLAIVDIPVDLSQVNPFGTATAIAPNTEASFLRLAVDQAGGAVIVFYESTVDWDARAMNFRPGTGWTAPVTLDVDVPYADGITVASDEAGNAIAAWAVQEVTVAGGSAKGTLFSSRYTPADGWGPAQLRPDVAADGVDGIRIAASRTGRFVLGWIQQNPVTFVAETWAQVWEGDGWRQAGRVQTSTNEASFGNYFLQPDRPVAVAANGDSVILWSEYVTSGQSPIVGAFLPK